MVSPARSLQIVVAATIVTLAACGEQKTVPDQVTGHMFSDEQSGIALDLPSVWAGRYQLSDSVADRVAGLTRELTLRFVRADSGVVRQPLLVVRVFERGAWDVIAPQGSSPQFGMRVAGNATHVLAVAMSPDNPLPVGTADAFGYDTLMISLNQRPFRAWMRRDAARIPPGPGAPATVSP